MSELLPIKTDRLNLRILETGDAEPFYQYHSLPSVSQYQGWKPVDLDDAKRFITENTRLPMNTADTWLQLAVCLKDGSLIGDVAMHFLDDEFHAGIGYTLAPEYQGKGYAFEAVAAVLDFLFKQLRKHRVTASVDPRNARSVRLLEKLGFRKEGHFFKSFRMGEEWCDDCIYAMLEEEWPHH